MFQFQLGTIGSLLDVITPIVASRFNSNLVRLGDINRCRIQKHFKRFNSNLVRLGVNLITTKSYNSCVSIPTWYDWEFNNTIRRIWSPKFQFQLGTIGRAIILLFKGRVNSFQFQLGTIGSASTAKYLMGISSFNSNLVRLGVLLNWFLRLLIRCFNSNLVRLGAFLTVINCKNQCSFNSNLVRLGVCCGKQTEISTPFQFQLGTIGSQTDTIFTTTFKVSIPTWYDWENNRNTNNRRFNNVSIPTWYDWEKLLLKRLMTFDSFQFQLGTIGSRSTTQKN